MIIKFKKNNSDRLVLQPLNHNIDAFTCQFIIARPLFNQSINCFDHYKYYN